MRSKTTNWSSFCVLYEYKTQKDDIVSKKSNFMEDWYFKAFLQNASLRPSCFKCLFKRKSGSDITLGDFWGINKIKPEVEYTNGVSAVICNTNKGVKFFNSILDNIDNGKASYSDILQFNPSLEEPATPYKKRDEFLCDLANSMSIEDLIKKYTFNLPLHKKFLNKTKSLIKKLFFKK